MDSTSDKNTSVSSSSLTIILFLGTMTAIDWALFCVQGAKADACTSLIIISHPQKHARDLPMPAVSDLKTT